MRNLTARSSLLSTRGYFRTFCTESNDSSYIRCAVVGSGPAGFYTAKYLLDKNKAIHVDILESLPTPYGLVRQGVAPDHQEVKSVMATFMEVAENSRFRYFGNVQVGSENAESQKSVSVSELKKAYDVVVLAYGASSDRNLGISGEDLSGAMSARSFVNWYNGHPNYKNIGESFDLSKIKRVVVIGQGNVAIDCARILMKSADDLGSTDIASHALSALKNSAVEEVVIIGRRGHVQASFTIKEMRELTKLTGVSVSVLHSELSSSLTEASKSELSANRPKHRIVELINKIADDTTTAEFNGMKGKKISFRFLLSPVEILSKSGDASAVGSIVLNKNKLVEEAGRQVAISTDEKETIACDLILKSVGYKSQSMFGVPFDPKKNVVPNLQGRVLDDSVVDEAAGNKFVEGLYVTGWLKRGPSGIIGTNITDAKETVECILSDIAQRDTKYDKIDPIQVIPALTNDDVITWEDYMRIQVEEETRGRGSSPQKPREKICDLNELISIAKNRK